MWELDYLSGMGEAEYNHVSTVAGDWGRLKVKR